MLAGCSSNVAESYLVGGSWYEKIEYKDDEPVDEASCIGYFTRGLEFKEDGVVYNELLKLGGEPGIIFIREEGYRHHYHVEKVNEDEIKLSGAYNDHELCYLERKDGSFKEGSQDD